MIDVKKGQPFTLPNGTTVIPGKGERGNANTILSKTDNEEEEQIEEEVIEELDDPFENNITFRRTLADLPSTPQRTNPLMLVLAYNMWGLDSHAISMLLNISVEQVESVMSDDLFKNMRRETLEAIRYAETGTIHGYLSNNALKAAQKIVANMNGKNPDRAFIAAKDVLDRSGYRPADRVEHVHKFEDDLRIVYVKEQVVPRIELDLKDIGNGNGS